MKSSLFIVALVLFVASGFTATYSIDFDAGTDSNAGTQGSPWRSIPGTRNVGDTADLSASYGGGVFTTSSKVPAGTLFLVKGGTRWDTNDGGRINITSSWYDNASAASPITIRVDTNWGSGAVTIDGLGITVPISLVLIQRDGVYVDGASANNLIVKNSLLRGIYYKEQAGSSVSLNDCGVSFVKFINNGTSPTDNSTGAGVAQLEFVRANGVTALNCEFDGGGTNWGNGLILGESGMGVTSAMVSNCVAYSHFGTTGGNDTGIGFKAFNGQARFYSCVASNNLKGFDLGEQVGDGTNIFYRLINSTMASNIWGLTMSDNSGPRPGTHTNLVLNCLVYSNQYIGVWNYGGPFTSIYAHNTFQGNGGASNQNSASIRIGNDNGERETVNVFFYNNICYKPAGRGNINVHYYKQDVDSDGLNLNSDYNSWIARAGENFGYWAGGDTVPDNQTYLYGADGPGHASGNWYAFYSYSTTGPTNGALGHFHADAHSRGTGADDTIAPPFDANYGLTSSYPGSNLSTQSWYTAEMGIDRNGVTRTSWDLGAFEYAQAPLTTLVPAEFRSGTKTTANTMRTR